MQYSAASIVVAASAKAGADGLVPVTQEESQSDEIITNEMMSALTKRDTAKAEDMMRAAVVAAHGHFDKMYK